MNRREFLELHQRTIPISMRERRPELELPPELDEAVMRCLKKRASERHASARELDKALAKVPLPSSALADSQPPSPGRAHRSA